MGMLSSIPPREAASPSSTNNKIETRKKMTTATTTATATSTASNAKQTKPKVRLSAHLRDFSRRAVPMSSQKEKAAHKAVRCSRILVLSVLFLSGVVISILTYVAVTNSEQDDYEEAFNESAEEVLRSASSKASTLVYMAHQMAAIYTSLSSESGTSLPFMTLQDFEAFGRSIRQASGTTLFLYTPYLSNEAYRKEWEQYTQTNQGWVRRGYSFDPHYNESANANVFAAPLPTEIWCWDNSTVPRQAVVDTLGPPYMPVWQMSPPPSDLSRLNLNLQHVSDDFAALVEYVRKNERAALSPPVPVQSWLDSSSDNNSSSSSSDIPKVPESILMHPVFSSLETSRAYFAAVVSAVVPWNVYFTDILQDDVTGLMVVVDSCGQNMTLTINGPDVHFEGMGDMHDTAFDSMVESRSLRYSEVFDDISDDKTYCQHDLYIYPTDRFRNNYKSRDAITFALIVGALFCFSALVFLIYDVYVTRRQQKTLRKARRTADLISSLFPGNLREMLFLQAKKAEQQSQLMRSNHAIPLSVTTDVTNTLEKHGSIHMIPVQSNSEPPIKRNTSTNDFVSAGVNRDRSDRPIAELFPEATVSFADIAGFTAWSSIREPSHVFTLLESIFRAFDECAKRHGVFKVETVGDCYVAVVGVPEYCKDHAVVMAKFARDCLRRFSHVVRGLELSLGPDTSDLAMRFGMHSGPVTAGVLRGDRARFQLFGDTVNTASKIEHSGVRGRIHMSEQTAGLIIAAGKSEWITPREEADPSSFVEGKGKGILQTYWCRTFAEEKLAASLASGSQRGTEEEEEEELEEIKGDDITPLSPTGAAASLRSSRRRRLSTSVRSERSGKTERRLQRLIDWNSELLAQLLRQVVARRTALNLPLVPIQELDQAARQLGRDTLVVDEVAEVITMPEFNAKACSREVVNIQLKDSVLDQLHQYVTTVASMYRDNPFHNFEHASHVTMSVSKLLSRIVAPRKVKSELDDSLHVHEFMHDHTYGITSDPLTQFAVVLSALVHDVDHRGVPNFILANEDTALANAYKNKSIAEQNSLDLAWDALMSDSFEDLRQHIFGDHNEMKRFRQLLVNAVIATDIFDKELGQLRKNRWNKAFHESAESEVLNLLPPSKTREGINRKATIVIEHLIQASDVAHTMQHWHVYQKWNERLFMEMYEAFLQGRSEKDPSENWYQGELGFFDNYIIPLAKKLKDCGVFGVASDEYLNYATENRREWSVRGEEVVQKFMEQYRNPLGASLSIIMD